VTAERLEDWDDESLHLAVGVAELPALLVTLAQLTGDDRYIDASLRASTALSPGAVPAQGGMSEEQQARARELILEGLRQYRDAGCPESPEPDEARLRHLMGFIAADAGDEYLPLMQHELDIPHDPAAPDWTVNRPMSVAIIGAGASGLGAAYRLRQAGIDVTVLERNADVGGTWLVNSYPGCRLDTSNFAYSLSFAQTAEWGQHYSLRDSIYRYFRTTADELGLRSLIRFNATVTAIDYDTERASWTVRWTEDGRNQERVFDSVVTAVGQLNEPLIPEIPGLEDFEGTTMHTARWDHSAELAGKRVAVVGTGASAFQVIPAIAPEVEHLSVFQRNAPWMYPTPNYLADIPARLQWLYRNVPYYHRWFRFFQFWVSVEGRRRFIVVDPTWTGDKSVSQINYEMRLQLEAYLHEQFADRLDLLPHVVPDYAPGGKRLLRDDGTWAAALKRDNVSLVTDGIDRIVADGIVTKDGTRVPLDVIVWGTGFRASEFFSSFSITRDGTRSLHEDWAGEAKAYRGVLVPDFPNLFIIYGPNTNLVVNGSIILFSEMATEFALSLLRMVNDSGADAIEVTRKAYEQYNDWVDVGNRGMAWGIEGVTSWYKSKSGRVSQNWPFALIDYWNLTRSVDDADVWLTRATVRQRQDA
jgi:4-hydroxyacetophenone monooxygenase